MIDATANKDSKESKDPKRNDRSENSSDRSKDPKRNDRSEHSSDRSRGRSRDRSNNPTDSDLVESVVSVRRVAKIVRGGARFSFSVLAIVGDCKGKIGVGKGKDKELNNAKIKAVRKAKNYMKRISLRRNRTLHHDIKFKYCSSVVLLKSAKLGTGIIAGGVLRNLCECLGIKDIVAKSYGSSNKYNMLFAALEGLKLTMSPKKISERRAINVSEVLSRKKISLSGAQS